MEPSLRPPYGKQKGFNSLKLCFITTQYQKSENSVLLDKRYKESKCQLANPIPCSSCTLSFKLVIKLSILIDFFLFFFFEMQKVYVNPTRSWENSIFFLWSLLQEILSSQLRKLLTFISAEHAQPCSKEVYSSFLQESFTWTRDYRGQKRKVSNLSPCLESKYNIQ